MRRNHSRVRPWHGSGRKFTAGAFNFVGAVAANVQQRTLLLSRCLKRALSSARAGEFFARERCSQCSGRAQKWVELLLQVLAFAATPGSTRCGGEMSTIALRGRVPELLQDLHWRRRVVVTIPWLDSDSRWAARSHGKSVG